jgi:hypothetical protein
VSHRLQISWIHRTPVASIAERTYLADAAAAFFSRASGKCDVADSFPCAAASSVIAVPRRTSPSKTYAKYPVPDRLLVPGADSLTPLSCVPGAHPRCQSRRQSPASVPAASPRRTSAVRTTKHRQLPPEKEGKVFCALMLASLMLNLTVEGFFAKWFSAPPLNVQLIICCNRGWYRLARDSRDLIAISVISNPI